MAARRLAAWAVHFYTMLGGLVGVWALFAAADGDTRGAFLLLVLSMVIDATDGLMARRLRISEVLPYFDGSMVDNVIDVLTFVWVPVFIMWREALLPHALLLAVPVLASLYAYGQTNMKSDDNFFIGFPSYWNVVALYLYWFQPGDMIAALMVIIPGVFSFIPTRYLYPSKNSFLWKTTWTLGALWFALLVYLLGQADPDLRWVWLSLLFPLYYLAGSAYVEIRARR